MDLDDKKSPAAPALPDNDFGTVRERRDFGPLEVSLHPLLPSPYRDVSFSDLTGWRYYPTANIEDRLGIPVEGTPSQTMVIPDSWTDRVMDHSKAMESTRRHLKKLQSWETFKRPRLSMNTSANTDGVSGAMANDAVMSSEPVSKPEEMLATEEESPKVFEGPLGETTTKKPFHKKSSADTATIATSFTAELTHSTGPSNSTVPTAAEATPAVDLAGPDVIPKQELYFLYGKRPRKVQIQGSDYVTWGNRKVVQELRFTAIFVCPITKEVFLAGRYGDSGEQDGGIWWYPNKNTAQHAAAARAWDCWNVREGRHHKKRLSIETPYSKQEAPELPMSQFPPNIREQIQEIQKEQAKLEEENQKKKLALPANPPSAAHVSGKPNQSGKRQGDRRSQQYHQRSLGHFRAGKGRDQRDQIFSSQFTGRDRRYDGSSHHLEADPGGYRASEYSGRTSGYPPRGYDDPIASRSGGWNDVSAPNSSQPWNNTYPEHMEYEPLGNYAVAERGYQHAPQHGQHSGREPDAGTVRGRYYEDMSNIPSGRSPEGNDGRARQPDDR